MREVEKWKWRIRWAGRTTTTRIYYTEAETLVTVPETDAERDALQCQRGRR
jgi:hypothetical protein